MKKNITSLILFLLLASHLSANNPLYLNIAGVYLPAMQDAQPTAPHSAPHPQAFLAEALTESQTRLMAFKVLSQHRHCLTHPTCNLDSQAWENLELYNGANLVRILKRTNLKLGEASLSYVLGQPTTSIPELERRKHIIKTLVENKELFMSLRHLLKNVGANERWLLAIWKEESQFFKDNFDRLYLANFMYGSSSINQSATMLEILRRGEDVGTFLLMPFSLLYIRHLYKTGAHTQFLKDVSALRSSSMRLSSLSDVRLSLFFSGSELLFSLLNVPMATYQFTQYYQTTCKSLRYLHNRLSYLAKMITQIKDVYVVLSHHRKALGDFPEGQALFDLFGKTEKNPQLAKLINLLDSPTFSEQFSYFRQVGPILVAHKLLEEVKDDLVPLLASLGSIDMYVSCATLFKESSHRTPFCFAQYASKERPYISLAQFWNPLVNARTIVTNTIELNNNVILTGQNTGGKSTILKGIALNILLAQTLGIAAAQKATITPFDCLSTYMNIKDNVKDNQSLFAAEVARAKTLMDAVASLPPHKKSFIVIDEAFKGTGSEAEGLSYWYAQKFGNFPNSMCINATHYPKLTALERDTNGFYHNYKVEVTVDQNRKLIRRYKLERGYTLHNIAEYILVEQGLV